MKKGLSVLLIAAALFGFYGGAVNLNDVLACKDYWEVKGEQTTADMNKLEDGINQLKDNEEAYLDGLDAVADGEEALAKGEADYAAGQATLAQGEADYAAAPAKLADARAQIAKGESDLADGKDSLDGLTKLIKGINKLLKGYKNKWRPGYEALKDGRNQLYKGSKDSKKDLTDLAAFLEDTDAQKAYVAAVDDVAGDDEKQGADDYKDFVKSTNTMAKALPQIQKNVAALDQLANGILAKMTGAAGNFEFAKVVSDNKAALIGKIAPLIKQKDASLGAQFEQGVKDVAAGYENFDTLVEMKGWPTFFASAQGQGAISQAKQGIALATWQATYKKEGMPSTTEEQQQFAQILANVTDDAAKTYIKENSAEAKAGVEAAVKAGYDEDAGLNAGKPLLIGAVKQVAETLDDVNEKVNGKSSKIKTALLPGLKKFNSQVTEDKIDELVDGQNDVAKGIRTIAQAVLGTKALRDGVEENLGSDAIKLLKTYKINPNPLNTKLSDFAAFEKQMDTKPGIINLLSKARGLLVTTKTKGQKTYNAGKAKLASGKAQYAQGLADYAAAPAKLAEGRAQLAEGLQKLMDGRQELADGKDKLAEYEDGEQQVRDGLATLVGTEPDGGLTSILERLDGKENFDDPNGHLELDEGLNAVEVGRGYQADSGELITKEITGRAVGTAAGLGAGVLAILAGILSFFKKNKGAGITALLSAAAGAAAIGIGTSSGMEFSHIAGSTVSSMPWVACGVLAAVAAIHALVHFAGNKTA